MYPDLLLPVLTYPDATSERAVRSGVALGARLGAALTVLTVKVAIPPVGQRRIDALLGLDRFARAEEARSAAAAEDEAACAAAAAAEAELTVHGAAIVAPPYLEGEAIAAAARTHDVCLLSVGPGALAARSIAESLLIGSGRPLLLYPEEVTIRPETAIGTVVVAWDGGRRAARAVADALPVLKRAAAVRVLVAVGEKPPAAPGVADDLVQHLDRHGVAATVDELPANGASIGDIMFRHVRATGADLLVMGGYGHARAREFVFGGATDAMLQAPPCPVLMSH